MACNETIIYERTTMPKFTKKLNAMKFMIMPSREDTAPSQEPSAETIMAIMQAAAEQAGCTLIEMKVY